MIERVQKEENLLIINEIGASPCVTQRELSLKIGISLGKTNYILKELIKKGFIKAKNFSDNPDKLKKIQYYLTKAGLDHKMQLMRYFLKAKENEYKWLKEEWDRLAAERVKKSAVSL